MMFPFGKLWKTCTHRSEAPETETKCFYSYCVIVAEECGCWARSRRDGDDVDSDEEDVSAARTLVDDCLGDLRGGCSDDDWSDDGWSDDDS